MRKRSALLVTTAIAGLLFAGAAQAADLPGKGPVYKAPPAVAGYNWTGFYIGAHVGAGWGTIESEIVGEDLVLPISSHTINGFLGGGQVGVNYQVNHWLVLGVEGQFSWSGLEGTAPCGPLSITQCSTEVNWLGSVAGRVGYAFDRTMLYVKAGVAFADSDYSADVLGAGVLTFKGSDTRTGFMIGAGVEHAFHGNWSAKLEYNYMDFGTDTIDVDAKLDLCALGRRSTNCVLSGTVPVDITQNIHLIKFGVNYRFWGGGPVSARY